MGCILKGGGGLYSRLVVGAVLMAAGPASRIGGRPVGLLELAGVPLIRRQLIALSGAGVDEVVVVLDDESAALEAVVEAFPITLARHAGAAASEPGQPDPTRDTMAAAWRTGLAALGGKLDAVILASVNQPLLGTQDFSDLIGAFKKRPPGTDRVAPGVEGFAGQPAIITTGVRDALLGSAAEALAASPHGSTQPWVVDHHRYRTVVASAGDLDAFERITGHALRWPAEPAATPEPSDRAAAASAT